MVRGDGVGGGEKRVDGRWVEGGHGGGGDGGKERSRGKCVDYFIQLTLPLIRAGCEQHTQPPQNALTIDSIHCRPSQGKNNPPLEQF